MLDTKKQVGFNVDRDLLQEFDLILVRLGRNRSEVLEQLMRENLEKLRQEVAP